jgi:SpoVK/Ycf46/Vps4 family AAA+-type ATPase
MLDDWGLARRIAYGRGVTALFYGPPGTGKTASAEAIAHELDRPICVVDYSKIQSCWVGETEKNITRAFTEAARAGAVLFWDEADAMFYDRDDASRSWEVRDVNVLLQQIERFEGLCILSTNRHATLDKAFERRISLKVEFAPPDRAMRADIWRKLLPPKMPLGRDVNLAALAEHDLTGGEIKNVVMNTARLAVCRGADATVMDADFTEAVRMELDGRWSAKGQMGFACASAEQTLRGHGKRRVRANGDA